MTCARSPVCSSCHKPRCGTTCAVEEVHILQHTAALAPFHMQSQGTEAGTPSAQPCQQQQQYSSGCCICTGARYPEHAVQIFGPCPTKACLAHQERDERQPGFALLKATPVICPAGLAQAGSIHHLFEVAQPGFPIVAHTPCTRASNVQTADNEILAGACKCTQGQHG